MLYDSLREKILPLPDDTQVYPAHGAGSLCGKSLSKETWSTLGQQRQFNYALRPMAKEEFVSLVACGQTEVPAYFPKSAAVNLRGARFLDELPEPRQASGPEILAFEGVVLDVRNAAEFGAGHISGALNIGLGGQFASWAGTLIEVGTPVAIAAERIEQVGEAVMRLARVGIETVKSFILMEEWPYETAKIEQVPVDKMNELLSSRPDVQFVDVRREGEYTGGHAPGAVNLTLSDLGKLSGQLDASRPTYVICQGGYRSSAGASILEKKGFRKLYNITGGTAAWIDAGLEIDM